jgi:hypothetical protein
MVLVVRILMSKSVQVLATYYSISITYYYYTILLLLLLLLKIKIKKIKIFTSYTTVLTKK